jgi:hypothetical protein
VRRVVVFVATTGNQANRVRNAAIAARGADAGPVTTHPQLEAELRELERSIAGHTHVAPGVRSSAVHGSVAVVTEAIAGSDRALHFAARTLYMNSVAPLSGTS